MSDSDRKRASARAFFEKLRPAEACRPDSAPEGRPSLYARAAGISIIAAAALSLVLAFANFIYVQAAHSGPSGSSGYRVVLSEAAAGDMKPIIDEYLKDAGKGRFILAPDGEADVYIGEEPRRGCDSVRVTGRPAVGLAAGSIHKVLEPVREYWFSFKRTGIVLKQPNPDIAAMEEYVRSYFSEPSSSVVTAVGDIIPARHVAEAMAKHGTSYPFAPAVPLVKGSDITFGNLECPLTDRVEIPYEGMIFAAPAKTVKGLKLLGLDVVTLANNHSTNFGREAFTDTLEVLEENGIKYAGGGRDYSEAHRPAVIESKGVKFAFLSYNSIEGSIDATASEPGVAWIRMLPFNPDSPEDIAMVERDIRDARQQADVVIPCFHWGEEYRYHPNASMVILAHKACDAGADMVIGQHPHSVQSIEWYKGKLIAYSLGNFIFDQRYVEIEGRQVGEQTRKGFALRCDFRRGALVSMELLPYRIDDNCRTIPLKGGKAQALMDKVMKISGWKLEGESIH